MNSTAIIWYQVDRIDLLDLLISGTYPGPNHRVLLSPENIEFNQVAVGYSRRHEGAKYAPPCVIVLPDSKSTETLAWIRTFSEDAWPLSQFARVVLSSEWVGLSHQDLSSAQRCQRLDRWAAVSIGEALAQGGSETELSTMPISRVMACFSTSYARGSFIYGRGRYTDTVVQRLIQMEADSRFARRIVSVKQLLPLWTIVDADFSHQLSPVEAAVSVFEAYKIQIMNKTDRDLYYSLDIDRNRKLFSNSIEDRVVAFHETVDRALNSNPEHRVSGILDVTLAAAAFLVGRGTSHAFLIKRFLREAPNAFSWFGLIAALSGPPGWDSAWLRAIKGAESYIRPEFTYVDVSNVDLSWIEYEWLSKSLNGANAFVEVSRMQFRTLLVEILPGVIAQLRLAGKALDQDQVVSSSNPSNRERLLREKLSEFLAFADEMRPLIENSQGAVSGPRQQMLGIDDGKNRIKRPRIK